MTGTPVVIGGAQWMRAVERRLGFLERRPGAPSPQWVPVTLNAAFTVGALPVVKSAHWAGRGWLSGNRVSPVSSITYAVGTDYTIATLNSVDHYPVANSVMPVITMKAGVPSFAAIYISTAGAIMFRPSATITMATTDYITIPNVPYDV